MLLIHVEVDALERPLAARLRHGDSLVEVVQDVVRLFLLLSVTDAHIFRWQSLTLLENGLLLALLMLASLGTSIVND